MPFFVRCCGGVFLALLLSFSLAQASHSPIQTTVCEVTADQEKFNNKRIRLRAEVQSDGIELTVLVDEKATCKHGLGIILSKQAKEGGVFEDVENAIYRQGRIGAGFDGKRVFATFVGIFTVRRTPPTRVLSIESVSGLEINSGPK